MNGASEKKVERHKRDDQAPTKNGEKSEHLIDLINLISDDKSLFIFKTIFLDHGHTSEILRTRLKLTKKQYYSRISRLTKAGLIQRQKGRYFVTAFGKVIYDAQILLASAIKNYWKLKAIDSLDVENDHMIPEGERIKIIDLVIGNQQIKNILLSPDF